MSSSGKLYIMSPIEISPGSGSHNLVPLPNASGSRSSQLGDGVATQLRDLILAGELEEDAPLRPEHLAKELGVSATPVREALHALRTAGFVRLESRRGFRVEHISSRDIADTFFGQTYLAGELAARACVAASLDDINKLRDVHKLAIPAVEAQDAVGAEHYGRAFHSVLYSLAASPRLFWLLRMAALYAPPGILGSIPGWPESMHQDHADILQAVAQGDADNARQLVATHVVHSGELIAYHFRAGA
jgi:DNA-binding GntR family transcriptional regulator